MITHLIEAIELNFQSDSRHAVIPRIPGSRRISQRLDNQNEVVNWLSTDRMFSLVHIPRNVLALASNESYAFLE